MSPWLTFVIGVILGLLIGWIIDWWYRRRETAASLKPVETRAAPPSWTPPQVETPTTPPVAPAVEASGEPLEALPDVEARTFEPPSEPVPPVEAFPPIPVELPPTVAVPVASLDAPALPAIERPAAAVEAPVVEEIHLPSVTAEVPELPEIHLPSVTAELPVSQVNLAAPVEQIDWPAVGDLPQVVTTDEVPVAPARIADELPMTK